MLMTPEAEALQRAAVVAEARTWLSTPYHHNARVKGVGVDCGQLPIAVYSALGLIPAVDPDYSPQWMLHRDEEVYLDLVRGFGVEIPVERVGPGDFAIWRFGRTFSHGAIVVDMPMIIHACSGDGMVLLADTRSEGDLAGRPVKFFTLWGQA